MSQSYAFAVSKSIPEVSKRDCPGDAGLLEGLNSSTNSALPSSRHESTTIETHDHITDASFDPRFDTFFKRLTWFQEEDETDKAFAERIGVSLNRFKTWKYKGRVPQYLSAALELSERLDVCPMWLWAGWNHHVRTLPSGMRLTSFPRSRIYYFITEAPDKDGQLPSLYAPEGALTQ